MEENFVREYLACLQNVNLEKGEEGESEKAIIV